MFRIKRTKQAPPTRQIKDGKPADVPGPVAVHYAAAVDSSGVILAWAKDAASAVAVTQGVVNRVQDHHAGRKHVGDLAFEPVDATGTQLASAVAADDAVGAAEFARLQAECGRLVEDKAELGEQASKANLEAISARAAVRESAAALQAATDRIGQLELDLLAQSERLAVAQARVLELEAAQSEKPTHGKKK